MQEPVIGGPPVIHAESPSVNRQQWRDFRYMSFLLFWFWTYYQMGVVADESTAPLIGRGIGMAIVLVVMLAGLAAVLLAPRLFVLAFRKVRAGR